MVQKNPDGSFVPASYTPQTNTIASVADTTTSLQYAVSATDVPTSISNTPTVTDQTGITFQVGDRLVKFLQGLVSDIYDQGDNPKEPLDRNPLSGTAGYCYSDDLITWTITPRWLGSSDGNQFNPLE